ncbi:response regulator [Roseisolibacter sp. H3M3-2]|uniref:response regulator n=1 Tax=Roseisolibacter sp. H3M3-2 TaxID=3031323 RepID=UPI0023DA7ECE|nr:response regulator [Roseisolibacter sp. H3M3-2]MDF1506241.1 response regulator [Roseisolibacter sp. H3M3-2]
MPAADVSPTLRILIVEDHEDLADALRANLRSEGYRASVASDGRQAFAMVRAEPPDIIVLDLGLPGLDGLALLSRLRAEGQWCPVLILSARDSDSDKVEGFRHGADDYVTKPFRTVELLARVEAMAERAARERAAASAQPAPVAAPPPAVGRAASVPPPDAVPLTAERLVHACGLTLRQAEVALLIAAGRSNPEIAERLGISRFTARNHAERVLARLEVESRWQVARTLGNVVAATAAHRGGGPTPAGG